MPDPQTANLGFFVPLNNADVDTWDVPVNANWTLLDGVLGGTVNVALAAAPVTLAPAQYNNAIINFTGTLTADVTVTLPPTGRMYTVINNCVDNVTFNVTLGCSTLTTYVCLPPGEPITVLAVNGNTVAFTGLGRVGTYWDFAGSSVPRWVTGSNPAPYLNCDGTAFSSAVYPALRDYLGVATLPDSKGRFRATLNQGSARLSGAALTGGLAGDTFLAGGGNQLLNQANIPAYALTVTDAGHLHAMGLVGGTTGGTYFGQDGGIHLTDEANGAFINATNAAFTGITVNSAGLGLGYAPPSYVGGLTLIRAG